MTGPGLEAEVKHLLNQRLGMPLDKIEMPARLVEDLGVDSLDAVELAIAAERAFDIEISADQVRELETVADVVALIQRLVEERSH
jgi:acyl carrier protein